MKKSGTLMQALKQGDIFTKLSFVIMGLSNLVRKQIVKGLLFLGMELGFIYYMVMIGVNAVGHLNDLGDSKPGMVLDKARGIYVKSNGDNSMLLLLAGVAACFIFLAFIFAWRGSVLSGFEAQRLKQEGKVVPAFIDDLKAHFDSKLHKTLMFLPILSVIMFNILPLIFMITIAFTNFDREHQPPGNLFDWVGIANFATMLNAKSIVGRSFWPILGRTLIWAIFSTFLNYIGGMILAITINRKGTKLKKMWRTLFVVSIAVPQFVSLLVMRSMLAADGPINTLLLNMNLIDKALPFFTTATWARVTVIIVNLWVGIPYTMLITSGILQNIPADLYESAKVDGANAAVTFFRITLPYMLFVTTPYLITQFIGNINNFNVIYFLTAGAPNSNAYYQSGQTDLLVTWLYKLTVNSFDYSYAAVIGILVFILSAALSLAVYRNTGSYKNEEGFQ